MRNSIAKLHGLFPADVRVLEADPATVAGTIFPEEEALMSRAVAKRRHEFAAGRTLARRALSDLGVAPRPILPDVRRAPIWPPEIIGSITHTRGYCGVAVARASSGLQSLGLDAEPEEEIRDEIVRRVTTGREQAAIARLDGVERGIMGRLLFSAKESVYKCQYPLTRRFLEFGDVEIELDASNERFSVRSVGEGARGLRLERLEGRWRRAGGLILTTCIARGALT